LGYIAKFLFTLGIITWSYFTLVLAAQATIGNLYFENVDAHLQLFLFAKEW
jgi:hypothetical protein